LGLTEEEIKENEKLWREENGKNLKPTIDSSGQMRSVGITPGGMEAEVGAQDAEADMEAPPETGEQPAEAATPDQAV